MPEQHSGPPAGVWGDGAQEQPGRQPKFPSHWRASENQTALHSQGQAEGEGANAETAGGCWEVLLRNGAQGRSEDAQQPRGPQALGVRGLRPLAAAAAVPRCRPGLCAGSPRPRLPSQMCTRARNPSGGPGPPPAPRADPQWESAQAPASRLRPGHLQWTGMGGAPSRLAQRPLPNPVSI